MRSISAGLIAALVLTLGGTAQAKPGPARSTGIWVNRVELSARTVETFEKKLGIELTPGKHWYDAMTGAWGYVGGPVAGFIYPGLDVGGRLWRGASGGKTNVIVNGRALHPLDVVALRGYGIPVQPGRYWLNQYGIGGYEGGPPMFNLAQLAAQSRQRMAQAARPQQRRANRGNNRGYAGRGRSALSTWDITGVAVY